MRDGRHVQVLVVGAGLGGLSATLFLARQGVDVLGVEKHPGTSVHPRAAGQTPRTMELMRTAGIEDEVLAVSSGGLVIKVAESLRGKVFHTIVHETDELDTSALSPAPWGMATQNHVEPILLRRAREFGAQVLFDTELVSFEQDGEGVTAQLLDRPTGRLSTVRADYLVAADGHRGRIREELGIPRHGYGSMSHHIGVIFDADLGDHVVPDKTTLYYLQNPGFTGVIGTGDSNIFSVEYHPERGESPADFTEQRCVDLIRIGADAPDLAVAVRGIQTWEMAAWVTERFRAGRVFLVGDAAKVTPPTGGLGGNTAVQDGFDIAWKLATVLRGEAREAFLDSYEQERKPFAELVVAGSLHNYVERLAPHLRDEHTPDPVDPIELAFGYRCRSGAVLAQDDDPAPLENPLESSGRPGFRAPHVLVGHDGAEVSTVDLFGDDWVLVTLDPAWTGAAKRVPKLTDPTGMLAKRYGIGEHGTSLVRPDGVVAWRSADLVADPAATVRDVLDTVLSRR